MQLAFEQAFAKTVGIEGDFSNDSNDAGGKTRFGVTEVVARSHGYTGDMRSLPLTTAKAIAKSAYWDVLRLDEVAAKSAAIAQELFDTSYNMGVGIAGGFLQRALNVLNRGAADYPDMAVDNVVGPVTLYVLGRFLGIRGKDGEEVMLRALNVQQGARYLEIAEGDPTQEEFIYGWLLRRVS